MQKMPAGFRIIIISFLLWDWFPSLYSQCNLRSQAKETIRLEMLAEGGNNGAGIAWNAERGYYYCAIAGNAAYPIEVFNEQGSSISNGPAGFDYRGIWYNPKSKCIEGNGFGEYGYWQSGMNNKGFPIEKGVSLAMGMNQPEKQSCGSFDAKKQKIYFLGSRLNVFTASPDGKMSKHSIPLQGCPGQVSALNNTAMIYTGCKKKELGVLDYELKKIYFFNLKGKFAGTVSLPQNSTTEDEFGFSFANEMVFIFDKEKRVWTGYAVFE